MGAGGKELKSRDTGGQVKDFATFWRSRGAGQGGGQGVGNEWPVGKQAGRHLVDRGKR